MPKWLLAIGLLIAIQPSMRTESLVRAALIADKTSVPPGKTFRIAVRFTIAEHWHIYWKNAGASGMPTSVKLTLPKGLTASAWRWPMPQAHDVPGVGPSFVYEDETALIADVTVAGDAEPGERRIRAHAQWLVCDESCVGGEADVEIAVTVGTEFSPAPEATTIDRFEALVPHGADKEPSLRVSSAYSGADAMKRTLTMTIKSTSVIDKESPPVVAPEPHPAFECGDITVEMTDPNTITFTAEVSALKAGPDWSAARLNFAVAFTETVKEDGLGPRTNRRAVVCESVPSAPASGPVK